MSVTLVHYDAMRRELDACHSVDEVREFRNKAMALETYARLANDHEAERKLADIRIRAERNAGKMLLDEEKGKGNQYARSPEGKRQTQEAANITPKQAENWQKLAAVPEDVFESRLADPYGVPSTTEIIRLNRPADQYGRPSTEIMQNRAPAANRDSGRVLTSADLTEMARPGYVRDTIKALENIGRWSERFDMEDIVQALDDENILSKVQRGLYVAGRIKAALDKAGLRRKSPIKLVE